MRKTFALFLFCLAFAFASLFYFGPSRAQNRSAKEAPAPSPEPAGTLKRAVEMVKDAKASGADFDQRALFQTAASAVDSTAQLGEVLNNGAVFSLDKPAAARILQEKTGSLTLPLPDGRGGTVELELVKVDIFAAGFKVRTAAPTSETLDESLGVHYRGVVKGDERSLAAVSVFKNEVMGFFSTPAGGNSVIGRLRGDNPTDRHVVYAEKDMKFTPEFSCEMEDSGAPLPESVLQAPEQLAAARCIRIYVEADYDLFLAGGTVANVTSYLTGLFNQSATIFANDDIPISLSEIFVWNVESPYSGANTSSGLLNAFQANRNSFDGDIGHLVALRGGGGIAAGFNAFCNTDIDERQCFSGIHDSYETVPTYSWSVSVFTHEMGHLMGSRHTHACVWNGNGTAIDGCGPAAGVDYEGFCSGAPLPTDGGTIMSYCHLVPFVGINFNQGFGPQPRNVILNGFNNASCLSDCSGGGCTYAVSPASRSFTAAGGSNSFSVTTNAGCDWTATVNAPALPETSLVAQENPSSPAGEAASAPAAADDPSAALPVLLNSTPIIINDSPALSSPYPSTINVSGLTGTITKVTAALNGLSHTYPDDVDVLLVGPGGQRTVLMSDAGGSGDVSGVNLTFDQGGAALPDEALLATGTYRPANIGAVDNFPTPGPGETSYAADLNVFNGTSPNGTWRLYVIDDAGADVGRIATGWTLGITTGSGTSWINITSGSSGTGSGTVNYTVSPNTGTASRTGTITVNGQTHTITQAGATTTVRVVVQTSPAGRSFTVDGTTYTTAQTFNWPSGSSHAIATTSPQNGSTGTRYVWSRWSDGGAISHTVSPTAAATYTANFTTQHRLTTAASPTGGGTVSPVSGSWYNAGQSVSISAAPATGYSFSGWTGSGTGSFTGSSNPATVTMNGPITQTASFVTVQPTNNFSISANPASATVTPGSSATYTVSTLTTGGNPQTVGLSLRGLPAGATASFSPSSVTSGFHSTLTVGTSGATPAGTYPLTITGTGSVVRTAVVNLVVSSVPTTSRRRNVALAANGATAIGSTVLNQGTTPLAAINGDRRGIHWGSDPATGSGWHDAGLNSFPDSLQVNFSGAKTINEVSVYSVQDSYLSPAEPTDAMTFTRYGVTDFEVQYWTGAAWARVPNGLAVANNRVKRTFIFRPLTTSRIRVYVNHALAGHTRIAEVEAFEVGPNVALASAGAVATASSELDAARGPAGTINGDWKGVNWGRGGGWHDATNATYPDWLQVNFSGAKTISEIDVYTVQDNYVTPVDPTDTMTFLRYGIVAYDVQYWNGSTWVTVPGGSVADNNRVWRRFTFPAVTTSAIRVLVKGSLGGYSRVVEVEAYQ